LLTDLITKGIPEYDVRRLMPMEGAGGRVLGV